MKFYLGPDVQSQINAAMDDDRLLTAPDSSQNSTFKPGKGPGLGRWSEMTRISDTKLAAPKDRPESKHELVFTVKFEVLGAASGGFDAPNNGRTWYWTQYINTNDLNSADSKQVNRCRRKFSTLNALLEAFGHDTSGGVEYDDYFNGDKPLLNATIGVSFNKYKYNKNVNGDITPVTDMEVLGFSLPSA